MALHTYIQQCQDQYYQQGSKLGRQGDFVTAPHLTPLFGYLIATKCLDSWRKTGSPTPIHVIECGPGTGCMIRDMVKVFKTDPYFWENCSISFVDKVSGPQTVFCLEDIASPQKGFFFVVGNEFLDALPIHQYYISQDGKKRPRHVAMDSTGYCFADWQDDHGNDSFVNNGQNEALPFFQNQKIYEECPEAIHIMSLLNEWLDHCLGLVMWIDYGDVIEEERFGDTLQGIYKHQQVSPFFKPGETDLSHHVDFASLKRAAKHPCNVTTQGEFLLSLGLETWLNEMEKMLPQEQSQNHRLSCLRLIHSQEMGTLFKVFMMSNQEKFL